MQIHPIQAVETKGWLEVMVSKGHDHKRRVCVCPTLQLEVRVLLDIEGDRRLQRP